MNTGLARSIVTRFCAGMVALALAVPLHAQENPPTIPTALVTALLGGFGEFGLSPRFVVGHAPADFPRALLPGGSWTTVGGFEAGPVRTVVLDAPRNHDALGEYDAVLTRAGLKEMRWARSEGGFVGGASMRARTYCDDSSIVSVRAGDSTATSRSVVVTRMRGPGARGCGDAPPGGFPQPLAVPPLRAPTGVRALRRGSGSGGDYIEETVQLDTTISVARALDHYAQQLGAAGWTVVGRPLVDGDAGFQRLSTRDTKGTRWDGALVAITLGADRQITLRMARPADSRGAP